MSDEFSIPSNPAYHAQARRDEGMDPGTRRLAMIAGGIVVGLGVLYGGVSYFGSRTSAPPVVQADPKPYRERPKDPGGMQVAGAGTDLFTPDRDPTASKLAAPPEMPDAKALRAQMTAPPAAAVTAPAPAPAIVAPAVVAPVAPKAAVAAAKPSVTPAVAKPPAAATTATAAPGAKPSAGAATGKAPSIQLAALGTEAAAHAEWQILQKRMPDLLNGRQPVFSKTERDGKSYWRVRTAGFSDATQAKGFCEKVRAKGGACSVAEF